MAKDSSTRRRGDDTSPYLRAPKPLRASRGVKVSREGAVRLLLLAALVVSGSFAWWLAREFVLQTEPFRISSDRGVSRIEGVAVITEQEVSLVFAKDIGRSLVSVDTPARLEELESIPWVRSASVARVWPNSIAVAIEERDPVAFLRMDGTNPVRMIDSEGMILDLRRAAARPLPVLTGISSEMPQSERRRRVGLFEEVMKVFRERGEGIGRAVSEIDVADLGNAIVLARHRDRMVRLQMGDRHLRHRLDVFLSYIEAWRSEYGPLQAVDLRFEKQVTVQPVSAKKGKA